jgi:hypothetical protein
VSDAGCRASEEERCSAGVRIGVFLTDIPSARVRVRGLHRQRDVTGGHPRYNLTMAHRASYGLDPAAGRTIFRNAKM